MGMDKHIVAGTGFFVPLTRSNAQKLADAINNMLDFSEEDQVKFDAPEGQLDLGFDALDSYDFDEQLADLSLVPEIVIDSFSSEDTQQTFIVVLYHSGRLSDFNDYAAILPSSIAGDPSDEAQSKMKTLSKVFNTNIVPIVYRTIN